MSQTKDRIVETESIGYLWNQLKVLRLRQDQTPQKEYNTIS